MVNLDVEVAPDDNGGWIATKMVEHAEMDDNTAVYNSSQPSGANNPPRNLHDWLIDEFKNAHST